MRLQAWEFRTKFLSVRWEHLPHRFCLGRHTWSNITVSVILLPTLTETVCINRARPPAALVVYRTTLLEVLIIWTGNWMELNSSVIETCLTKGHTLAFLLIDIIIYKDKVFSLTATESPIANFQLWHWIVLGVSAFVLIVLSVMCILLRRRWRRSRGTCFPFQFIAVLIII